jgi:hypothetical protein
LNLRFLPFSKRFSKNDFYAAIKKCPKPHGPSAPASFPCQMLRILRLLTIFKAFMVVLLPLQKTRSTGASHAFFDCNLLIINFF